MTAPVRPRGVLAAGPRLQERARAERSGRRRRWGRRVLLALAALVPVLVVAWVVLVSPLLAVDRVLVTGTERLTPEQVLQAAAVQPGTPLARVDTAEVSRQVRELAPVATVQVRRAWPATLRVEITERVAVAGAPGPDGVELLDAAGVPFAAESLLPAGLARLEVRAPGADDPATRAALGVLLALPPELRAQVEAVRASTASDVSFGLAGGRTVVWGTPGDTASKAAAVTALLPMPGTLIDVSAPGVAVRR